jgi:TPR repeat protein
MRVSKPRKTSRPISTVGAVRSYRLAEEEWSRGDMTPAAFRHFLSAAEGGVKSAYRIVGECYDFGEGTTRSKQKALHWYKRACREDGDASAANNIGCIHRDNGEVGRALWWFRVAVGMGDVEAHLSIAKIHLGILHDRTGAMRHLKLLLKGRDITEGSREEAEGLLQDLSRVVIPMRRQ